MGSTSQLYSLTWGEFSSSLASAVQLLRCHGDMVDVTLAAGGRSFPAHKIVLCAASPFLLNLLKSTPCKHPVVLLAGVGANDLEALLEFVYRGEVSVDPNQLPSLLQAAHCLNIQGLAPGTMSAEKLDENSSTLPSTNDALTRDVINSFLPIRRRKRAKRRASSSSGSESKWARTDNAAPRCDKDLENQPCVTMIEEDQPCVEQNELNVENGPSEQQNASISTPIAKTEDSQPDDQVQASLNAGPWESHSLDSRTASSKSRGPSEQPGVCPLCGAMLRQARNLRRHLLTSCRYRMPSGVLPPTCLVPTSETRSSSPQPTTSRPSSPTVTVPLPGNASLTIPLYLHQPWSPTRSHDSQTYEQIVCKVSPTHLPVCGDNINADYSPMSFTEQMNH